MLTPIAQIVNKALPGGLQNASSGAAAGAGLGKYIGILWQTAIVVGGLAAVMYMILGGLRWVLAGGDKGKIEHAKEQITQGLIGLAVLISIAAISTFMSTVFGFDLLKPNFSSISGGTGGGGGGGSTETCSVGDTSPYLDSSGEYGCGANTQVFMKCVGPSATFPYNHWQLDHC